MFEFLFLVSAIVGLTNIFLYGSNFDWFRQKLEIWEAGLTSYAIPYFFVSNIKKIWSCPQCMGTWVGFFCGFLLFGFDFSYILLSGFCGSFASVFFNTLINYLEAQTLVSLDDEKSDTLNHINDYVATNIKEHIDMINSTPKHPCGDPNCNHKESDEQSDIPTPLQ